MMKNEVITIHTVLLLYLWYHTPQYSSLAEIITCRKYNINFDMTGGTAAENAAPNPIGNAITQGLLMFMVMNFAQRYMIENGIIKPPTPPVQPMTNDNTNADAGSKIPAGSLASQRPHRTTMPSCIWKKHTQFDLHFFVTDVAEPFSKSEMKKQKFDSCLDIGSHIQSLAAHDILAEWHEMNLELYSLDSTVNSRNGTLSFDIPHAVQYNHTQIYAHICMEPQNMQTDAKEKNDQIMYKTVPLTKYKRRKRIKDERSLLGGDNSTAKDESKLIEYKSPLTIASTNTTQDAVLMYLKPSLTLQLVDMNGMPHMPERSKIPPQVGKHMEWLPDEVVDGENIQSNQFYPLLYSSEFWITRSSLVEINETVSNYPNLEVKIEPIKVWKWQLMAGMEEQWENQSKQSITNPDGDEDAGTDMFRMMLMETNPILLAVTGIVSVLHTVFDALAFKNDVKFFKNKKSMEGISVRSMIVNMIFQLIILLYLVDNETSFMVICSNAVGVAIEVWKIKRAVTLSLFDENGKLNIKLQQTETYSKSKTKEYDEIATDHLMYITMPLICGYGIYSLFYQKHKGWYSFILNTLVGFIYMFGCEYFVLYLFLHNICS